MGTQVEHYSGTMERWNIGTLEVYSGIPSLQWTTIQVHPPPLAPLASYQI